MSADATPSDQPKKPSVDDFEFGKTLGEGSFGDVVLCTHKASGRSFAAKKIEKQHLVKTGNTKYAVLEREVLTACKHPSIIKLFYSFRDPSCLYYILELAPNGELKDHIRKHGNFNLESSKFYAAEILQVLEYLHFTANIIHRDLKPENVLLSDTMHVKLTDFGTAKRVQQGETRVRTASFMGTAEYIAPECLADEPEVCRASDLWALGCILFQMLAGRPPFHGDNQFLTFEQVRQGKVSWPAHFPLQARLLIEQLLSVDPESRHSSEKRDYNDLKQHEFFSGINWTSLADSAAPEIQPNEEYTRQRISGSNWSHLLSDDEKVLEYGMVKHMAKTDAQRRTKAFLILTSRNLHFLNKSQTKDPNELTLSGDEKTFTDISEFDPARWGRALKKAVKKLEK